LYLRELRRATSGERMAIGRRTPRQHSRPAPAINF